MSKVKVKIPSLLYVCPKCLYANKYRWVLRRHLELQHGLTKENAKEVAGEFKYKLCLSEHIERFSLGEE